MLVYFLSYFFLIFTVLFKRRNFDLFTIAGFGMLMYFIPFLISEYDISNDEYYVFSFPLLLVICFAYFNDYLLLQNRAFSIGNKVWGDRIALCATFIAFILFCATVFQVGFSDLFVDKKDKAFNFQIYAFFISSTCIGLLYSIYVNNRKTMVICSTLIFLVFLMGSRTHVIICLLSLAVLHFSTQKEIRLVSVLYKPKVIIMILIVAIIGVVGKDLYAAFQVSLITGESFLSVFLLRLDNLSLFEVLLQTEPYHTSEMLYFTVSDEFRIDSWYLTDVIYHFFPVSSPFTDTLHHFSNEIKGEFYSDWGSNVGVAGNYWAEGYANFGFFGVIIWGVIFNIVLIFLNALMYKTEKYAPIVILIGVFWGFYIQRNSLFQIISHDKRNVYVFIAILIFSILIKVKINGNVKRG